MVFDEEQWQRGGVQTSLSSSSSSSWSPSGMVLPWGSLHVCISGKVHTRYNANADAASASSFEVTHRAALTFLRTGTYFIVVCARIVHSLDHCDDGDDGDNDNGDKDDEKQHVKDNSSVTMTANDEHHHSDEREQHEQQHGHDDIGTSAAAVAGQQHQQVQQVREWYGPWRTASHPETVQVV